MLSWAYSVDLDGPSGQLGKVVLEAVCSYFGSESLLRLECEKYDISSDGVQRVVREQQENKKNKR